MLFTVEEPDLRRRSFSSVLSNCDLGLSFLHKESPPTAHNGTAYADTLFTDICCHEASHQANFAAHRGLGFHPAGNHRTGSAIPAGRTVHSSRNDYSLFAVRLGQISVGETAEAFSENRPRSRPVCCQGCHRVETIFSPSRNCPLKLASKWIEAASYFSQRRREMGHLRVCWWMKVQNPHPLAKNTRRMAPDWRAEAALTSPHY
jgi:hypothetical protein